MKCESADSFSINPFRSILLTNTPGEDLISLSPSSFLMSAFLIKKLDGDREIRSSPGVFVSRMDLKGLMEKLSADSHFIYLREGGTDIRENGFPENPCYILGDDRDPTEEEEEIMSAYPYDKISLGPVSLHANHCMIIVHNEMDRRAAR